MYSLAYSDMKSIELLTVIDILWCFDKDLCLVGWWVPVKVVFIIFTLRANLENLKLQK